MQAAHRGMRIPCALGAVLLKYFSQAPRVFGEMWQRHRAVFDETHRLTVALHRHHDIEASFPHFPYRFLQICIRDFHHTTRETEISHEFRQLFQFGDLFGLMLTGKLDEQHAIGFTLQKRIDRFFVNRDASRQIEHGAVHQFHGGRPQLHNVLCGIHASVKPRKMANTQSLVFRQLTQLQMDALEVAKRTFRSHQQFRQIESVRRQAIEVVARYPSGNGKHLVANFVFFARIECLHRLDNRPETRAVICFQRIHAKMEALVFTQPCVDAQNVVNHVPIRNRT